MRQREERPIVLVRPPVNVEQNAPFFLPLGLLCVASLVRNAGFRVEIVDYEFLVRAEEIAPPEPGTWLTTVCKPVLEQNPLIVGLTALADTLPTCLLIGRFLKNAMPEVPVVIGGPGTFGMIPGLAVGHANSFDYLCVNEGELPLLDLAERAIAGEKGAFVRGLWSPRAAAESPSDIAFADLDELPMPAYDLLPIERYIELATPRIFDIHLGTGCTYSCKFCVTSTFWKRTFRSKSPERVMSELDYLNSRYGIKTVNFLHDNFANQKHYLNNFIDYFIEHNRTYEWGCAVRPDNVTKDQLERMREAGCTMIFCGTDSGSTRILKAVRKMTKLEWSYSFFNNCRAADIAFETNAIIGFPDEADSDLEDTLELVFDAVAYGAANSDVSVLQPLPGSELALDHRDSLEWVGQALGGAFLPPEALELASAEAELFTGFSFIRRGNRPFEFYASVTVQIRFFTRHYFRTLYFLKHRCEISYLGLFSQIAEKVPNTDLNETFRAIWRSLPISSQERGIADAVFAFDEAMETIKGLDVQREIENIYARSESEQGALAHTVVSVAYPVHVLFEAMPGSIHTNIPEQLTHYLLYRTPDENIVTVRLASWQLELWSDVSERRSGSLARAAKTLASSGIRRSLAESAAARAAATFESILRPEIPLVQAATQAG